MKFKISNRTQAFSKGLSITALSAVVISFIVAIGFNSILLDNVLAIEIFLGFNAVMLAICFVFVFFMIIEALFGGSISVEEDYIEIRTLFRHKIIPFCDIDGVDYSHYEIKLRRKKKHTPLETFAADYKGRSSNHLQVRARLDIYYDFSKKISLNDSIKSYRSKFERDTTIRKDFTVNKIDNNVPLYQAYVYYKEIRGIDED